MDEAYIIPNAEKIIEERMAPERRTFLQLLVFSSGLFAVQTFWGFNSATFPLYLNELTGSKTLTGLALSIGGVFGAVMPVIVGGFSDRTHTRWGKRKPFILAGWVTVLLSLALLYMTTSIGAAMLLSLFLYAGFFTAIGPYFALLPDLTPPGQRGIAAGMMFLMGGVGILSFMFFGARNWDTARHLPFVWAAMGISVSAGVMIVGTREPPAGAPSVFAEGLLGEAFRNRPVLIFLAAMTSWWTGLWMVMVFFVIAVRDMLHVDTGDAVIKLLFLIAVYVACALPAGMMGDRLGHRRVTAAGLVVLALSMAIMGFTRSVSLVWILLFFAGGGYAVVLTVAYTYYLRLIPADRTAGYMGLYMACQNGALLAGPAAAGLVIDTMGPRAMFICAAGFIAAGLALFVIRKPRQ
ncbi:MAG: MFS transporter [Spirochaetes bacterium]|nr:MAG: MFS transporter [Spirochaetota bacterium]